MRFLIKLLITFLFIDEVNLKLSFILRHNLYPRVSYSTRVCSQKYSPPCVIPRVSYPFSIIIRSWHTNRKSYIGFRDNQTRTDNFHHIKVPSHEEFYFSSLRSHCLVLKCLLYMRVLTLKILFRLYRQMNHYGPHSSLRFGVEPNGCEDNFSK